MPSNQANSDSVTILLEPGLTPFSLFSASALRAFDGEINKMSGVLRNRSWLEWLIQIWEEVPEPTLIDRIRILCLLYAELDSA